LKNSKNYTSYSSNYNQDHCLRSAAAGHGTDYLPFT